MKFGLGPFLRTGAVFADGLDLLLLFLLFTRTFCKELQALKYYLNT